MDFTPEELAALRGAYKTVKGDLAQAHTEHRWEKKSNSTVLIVDGNNTFLRCWSAISSMNINGDHTGGIVGFFRSVGYAIKNFHPTRCIVAFDGVGGSHKRSKIYPDYKAKRKGKIRLNRTYEDEPNLDDEQKNCINQYIRLNHYLTLLPVNVLRLDHVEADDTIAYCATDTFKDSEVIIMSSDKDFLQLITNKIKVWSPTKKVFYGPAEVLRDYGIHPNNFVLFRAMDGDDSDGIDGINGAGIKTVLKCFPFLSEEKTYSLDDIISHAIVNRKRYKIYEKIIEGKEILERNIALMQLKDTLLTATTQLKLHEELEASKVPLLNRNAFIKSVGEDGMINNFTDHQSFLTEVFGSLDSIIRT